MNRRPQHTLQSLHRRIGNYLGSGGLFNPELMEHDKVSALMQDLSDALPLTVAERDELAALLREANGELDYMSEPKGKDRDHDLHLRIDAALARLGVPE
jgi:hypothetical protein